MKFNKKVLSIFFIALLAIVLVACGGTTTTVAPTTGAPTTVAPTTQGPTTQAPTTVAPTTDAPIDLLALIEALKTQYADTLEDEDFIATEDLNLITSFMGVTIAWQSSNPTYLENDGTIHRPSYALGDQTVILTATLSHGDDSEDVMFFVTIAAQEKTDQERANEVFVIVTAFPVKEIWTEADNGTLDFLTSGQDADGVSHDVVWTSSHPDIISVDGVITQPGEDEENVVVTMTATITINSVEYSTSKTFTVAKKAGATEVSTFAEAVALGVDAYVRVMGVTYLNRVSNGYYFTDGVDIIFVYVSSLPVEPGDVVDLTGIVAEYYGYAQFAGSDDKPIITTASDAEAKEPLVTEATIEWIMANRTATAGDMKLHAMYTVTGRVYHASSYTDPVYLVPSDYDFETDFSADAKPIGAAIEIYDYSNDTLLIPFHGKEVTINILPLGFHSGHSNHHANFIGGTSDIIVSIEDDAEAVQTALDALIYPGTIVEDTTLEFPASLYGVSIEYVSDNAAINVLTGFVDAASQTGQITVNITVTATRGAIVDTKVITIKVGELPVSTLAEVLAAAEGTLFRVQATVIGGGYGTYHIQDATGAIGIYANSSVRDTFAANIGNVVEIVGTRGSYNGLLQISAQTIVFIEEGTLPTPINLDDLEINGTNFLPYQSHMIELTGMEVVSTATDSNGNITLSLMNLRNGTTIAARWDSRFAVSTEFAAQLAALVEGDIINIQAILGWFNVPQIAISNVTVITMTTDAEKLAADVASLPMTLETTSGAIEMAPIVGPYGSTIVWDATEITAAGGTYDPLTGEVVYPTVTETTVYNVTGTVSLGTETPVDVSLAITVLAMTEEEKLQADMDALSITMMVNSYHVETYPTAGTYGSVISWSIMSGDATLDGSTVTYNYSDTVFDVTIWATFTLGELPAQQKGFTVTVTPVTIITDFTVFSAMTETVYDMPNGQVVFLKGFVTGIVYDGVFLQDTNGVGMFLYRPDSKALLQIGDEVVYTGALAAYSGARQLASGADLMEMISQGNPLIYNNVTADEIDAFAGINAGSLYAFAGFTYQGVSGSTMTLGYTKTDLTTGTVNIRYYSNWSDLVLVAANYEVGDALPEVQFILYNFRDGLKQLDSLFVPGYASAIAALETNVSDAMTYVYDPVYVYNFETSVLTGNNLHNEYLQSVLLAANPADMYQAIIFDMARYFGAIYRTLGSVATTIVYDGVEYTWNEAIGLLGSNWVDSLNVTLVSVIVDDFQLGLLTDGVVLQLFDAEGYAYEFELTFNITMDLEEAIETNILAAAAYEYDPVYEYNYALSEYADYVVSSVYLQATIDTLGTAVIMNDMARFLGALYRADGSVITTIVYDTVEYTWNVDGLLLGSNWEDALGVTLVSVITADFVADPLLDTITLTLVDGNGFGLDVDLTFSIVESLPVDPVVVTAAYPGGTTTNMTADNNAASIGLDPLIFNVVSTPRVLNPLHVGLNTAGQIRLYGDANGDGNILTISIDSAYTITEVEFVFGSTVGNALILTGSTEQFNGALTASSTLTYTGLDVTQFSIQNINTSTGQIYILSIKITYIPA